MDRSIRIVRPAGGGGDKWLSVNIAYLESRGFNISYNKRPSNSNWPHSAGSILERAEELQNALLDPFGDIILCARGGYGSSDILPLLPWDSIAATRRKLLVGFSDITSIHSALWTKLGWLGIHGPMPATELWGFNSEDDIDLLLRVLSKGDVSHSIPLEALNPVPCRTDGTLFGGCLSVLCAMIGTPFFPKDLSGSIFFLEDIGENPGQIMRHWNHLIQSQALDNTKAIVLGNFSDLKSELVQNEVKLEMAKRISIPTYSSSSFGHSSPNWCLPIGARASIDSSYSMLEWTFNTSAA